MSRPDLWSFIDTGYDSGTCNMSYDRQLLEEFEPNNLSGIFRLYRWNPPAISLGRFQKPSEVLNIDKCHMDNIDIVQRITGGGAIYHNDELTYSIVCRADCINTDSVKESYKKLSYFLITTYRRLNLDAKFAYDYPGNFDLGKKTDFCFAGTEIYDILINGRKIGGNAQKRKRDIIFQHGSIPLSLDTERIKFYFKNPLESDAISLKELDNTITIDKLKDTIIDSFQKNMGISFIENLMH